MRYKKQLIASLAAALLCGGLSAQTDIELITASYFGGFGDEAIGSFDGRTSGVFQNGDVIVCGNSSSFDYWTSADALMPSRPGPAGIVTTRFNQDGIPVYSSFLGGSGIDSFTSMAMLNDSAVIAGNSGSADYPVTADAHEAEFPGNFTGVLTCLSPDGALAWSTYLGNQGYEAQTRGVHVSSEKAIYLSGASNDPNLATPGVHMDVLPFDEELSPYIARFDTEGALVWCTYYDRRVSRINSSPDGSLIYVFGQVPEGPDIGFDTHQQVYGGGASDAFLACFEAETGTLVWETYYGGEGEESIGGIEVAGDGLIYITGTTWPAEGISTPGTHQEVRAGDTDAFLACFEPDGQLLWGTYFGGEGFESSNLPKLKANSLYLAGGTNSPEGITFGNPVEPNMLGASSSYLTKWNRLDGTLEWATYIGSTPAGNCSSAAVELLSDGKLLLTGAASGNCPGFITADAWQTSFGGGDFDIWYAIYSESTLSTANSSLESGLRAFPNPVRDVLTIVRSGLQANDAYTVHDISGRVVMQGILSGPQAQLTVGHLSAGIYLLRVDGPEKVSTLKIVKE